MTGGREAPEFASNSETNDPTIRSRVIRLVAIALLPFIGVMAWLATDYATVQRRVIEIGRLAVADKLSRILDREIASIQGTLTGLAGSEDLMNGDFERFGRHAATVATQQVFDDILVVEPAGTIVYSSNGSTKPLQARLRASINNEVFRGHIVVSELDVDNVNSTQAFYVAVPASKNGHVAYAVLAKVRPERLGKIFAEAKLEPEWISAIVDKSGTFLARSLNPEHFVGQAARPELGARAAAPEEAGEFENTTHEGIATVNSFRKSIVSGWTAVVAVPREILNAPFRRAMTYVLIGSALTGFLSVGAAWLLASRISEPIRRLRDLATALIEGRTPPDMPLQIAELNEVKDALKKSVEKKEHLAAIVASSGDAIMSVGLDGHIRSWNIGAEKLFGFSADEMLGQPKERVVPEDRRGEFAKHIATITAGESMRTETVRKTRDGKLIDVSLDMAPIRDADGKIIAMSSIIHDISNRTKAARHQRFLMRELTHRTKNILAIVQSMARQTARSATSIKEFETQYMQRLQGLAASHDLLVNQNWTGVLLDELIEKQVETFVEANLANVAITGPKVKISAKAAQTVGLALHELATNSMKYGALSIPQGKVSIDWEYFGTGEVPQQLRLKWEEHDGPPVTPPTRKGFGHFVIERMATQSLNAQVQIDFRPEGLIWILTVPKARLEEQPEFESGDSDV